MQLILDEAWLAALDRRAVAVLLLAPACLTWREYFGSPLFYARTFGSAGLFQGASPALWHGWLWWSGTVVGVFFIIPACLVRFGFGQRLRDYGVGSLSLGTQVPLALGMYALVAPALVLASRQPSFLQTYPLCPLAVTSFEAFLMWQVLYWAQFFAVEYFFRGFLIFGLERALGPMSIFVATVPYCMLHYGKPALESYAAIIAGVVLGAVAYRTRSLWSGFLVHVLVALTMDVLALQGRHVAWLHL